MRKISSFIVVLFTAVLVSAGSAYSQDGPPMVSIVGVSPQSGTTPAPLQVQVTYSVTKSCTVYFYVDGTQVGTASVPAGQNTWTTSSLTAATHQLGVACPGNAQYFSYVVPSFSVTPVSDEVPSTTTSQMFSVSIGGATLSWTVSSSAGWVTVSPTSGTNSGSFIANFSQNATYGRTAYIKVTITGASGSSASRTVTLLQDAPLFTVKVTGDPTYDGASLDGEFRFSWSNNWSTLPIQETVSYGQSVSVDEQPFGNCYFSNWTINGTSNNTVPLKVTVTTDESIVANFGNYKSEPGKKPGDLRSLPSVFAIGQNYPNPFNPTTDITYQLPKTSNVSIEVYNMLGQEVAVLADGTKGPGYYSVTFNGSGLASGIYLLRLIAAPQKSGEPFIRSVKMMLVK